MSGFEPFLWALLALGWVVFEIIRRVAGPPRKLGTIDDAPTAPAEPREAPLDVEWGRNAPPRAPRVQERSPSAVDKPPLPAEPFLWSGDRAQAELRVAREIAARQAVQRQQAGTARALQRHPRRPALRDEGALRDAIVLTAILGRCRAEEPFDGPQPRPRPDRNR